MEKEQKKTFFSFLTSFSKIITIAWLAVWIESILFSQLATIFSLGDSMSIQYIIQTVTEIGVIIAGFYFSSKTIENVAKGIQRHRSEMLDKERCGMQAEEVLEEENYEEVYEEELQEEISEEVVEELLYTDDADSDALPFY